MAKSYTLKNIARQQQINDFANLTIGATDVDGLIEYKNKAYIFFEVKYKDKKMSLGQRIALERLVNDISRLNKKAILLLCEHDVSDTNMSIDVSSCRVRGFFYDGDWYYPDEVINVNDIIKRFLKL